MNTRNCSLPAPDFYASMMHNFHIVSFPVYIISLNALFRETSKIFQTYKYYIIAHILINIMSECYVSFFMLPMTYLPHPLIRNTGWLTQWEFSGMFQFYGLAQMVMITVGSILEMFYFRLQITLIHFTNSTFKKLMKFQVFLYRILIAVHPLLGLSTIHISLEVEKNAVSKLYKENPTLPPEVTCYSVIMAVLDDVIFWMVLCIYSIQVMLQLTVSSATLIFITKFVKAGFSISKTTVKLQKMMIISLFIQGSIHGFMIMVPTMFMIYALFFHFQYNDLAHAFLMCVAYHGFASTCAMIIFTKPIQEKVMCMNTRTSPGLSQIARVISSTSQERSSHALP